MRHRRKYNQPEHVREKGAANSRKVRSEKKRRRSEAVQTLHTEGYTIAELAAHFSVSQRTIYRDLETLGDVKTEPPSDAIASKNALEV